MARTTFFQHQTPTAAPNTRRTILSLPLLTPTSSTHCHPSIPSSLFTPPYQPFSLQTFPCCATPSPPHCHTLTTSPPPATPHSPPPVLPSSLFPNLLLHPLNPSLTLSHTPFPHPSTAFPHHDAPYLAAPTHPSTFVPIVTSPSGLAIKSVSTVSNDSTPSIDYPPSASLITIPTCEV